MTQFNSIFLLVIQNDSKYPFQGEVDEHKTCSSSSSKPRRGESGLSCFSLLSADPSCPYLFHLVRPFSCTTDLPRGPCRGAHVLPADPPYPVSQCARRTPPQQPCTPPSVYIPRAPPPLLSLSTLHHHHAPSTPPTDCWGCPCSPRWHWRPPWPPWGPPRRASWRASRGTSCRAP